MKSEWQILQEKLKERFGSEMDMDALLFMIGLNELSKSYRKYKKDQKLEVMHVAICTLLEPYGFYEFKGRDEEGWPHRADGGLSFGPWTAACQRDGKHL